MTGSDDVRLHEDPVAMVTSGTCSHVINDSTVMFTLHLGQPASPSITELLLQSSSSTFQRREHLQINGSNLLRAGRTFYKNCYRTKQPMHFFPTKKNSTNSVSNQMKKPILTKCTVRCANMYIQLHKFISNCRYV